MPIVNAPWYVRNKDIQRDLGIPTVMEEISKYAEKYKEKIATHPNRLAAETINTSNIFLFFIYWNIYNQFSLRIVSNFIWRDTMTWLIIVLYCWF